MRFSVKIAPPLFLSTALATFHLGGPAMAQVRVQLPTIDQFGVSTTVAVPDRGRASLGGVHQGYQSGYYAPGYRSFGGGTSTARVVAGVTIIDHHEIDRKLLAEAARRRGAEYDVLNRHAPRSPRTTAKDKATHHHVRSSRESYLPSKLRTNLRGATPSVGMLRPYRYRYSTY